MDVNNIGQSSANLNAYSSNVSEYKQTNTEVSVPQAQEVQKVQSQVQDENKNQNQEPKKKDIENALNKINNFLKEDKTHAEYTYNEEMKTMMVKIIDENTKEVVLEIPPKKILDMVASMMRQVGLLDKKA